MLKHVLFLLFVASVELSQFLHLCYWYYNMKTFQCEYNIDFTKHYIVPMYKKGIKRPKVEDEIPQECTIKYNNKGGIWICPLDDSFETKFVYDSYFDFWLFNGYVKQIS